MRNSGKRELHGWKDAVQDTEKGREMRQYNDDDDVKSKGEINY